VKLVGVLPQHRVVTCSFCGKSSDEAAPIVTAQTTDGHVVLICPECISVLADAVSSDPDG
jgi:predicted metal-binding protein